MEHRQQSKGGPSVPALGQCAVGRLFGNNAVDAALAARIEAD